MTQLVVGSDSVLQVNECVIVVRFESQNSYIVSGVILRRQARGGGGRCNEQATEVFSVFSKFVYVVFLTQQLRIFID